MTMKMSVHAQEPVAGGAVIAALPRLGGGAGRDAARALIGEVPRDDAELIALARAHAPRPETRRAALRLLEPAWDTIGLPPASREHAKELRDPQTLIVIAGQQPALAGGPLYIFGKALSAARLARRLRGLGRAAVPLFWIADDDHDVDELFAGALPARDGQLWRPPSQFAKGRMPIAALTLPAGGTRALLDSLRARLPRSAQAAQALARLERAADPAPARWFLHFLVDLLREEGILPVTPAMLRSAIAPHIAAEIGHPGRLAAEVERASEGLRRSGIEPPIAKGDALPFFLHDASGDRHRLDPTPEGARVRNAEGAALATMELAALAATAPERFSPDALFRPLVQDAVLEPFAAIVGPTELNYHMQLAEAYRERGIGRPLLMPRLSVRIVDRPLFDALQGAGIDPAAIESALHPAELAPSPAAARESEALGAEIERAIARLEAIARGPRATPALARRAERLVRRWRDDARKLAEALQREISDVDVLPRRALIAAAQSAMWPGGERAERAISVLYYLARYGEAALAAAAAAYDPYDDREKLIALSPFEEQERKDSN